jgi:hypothetical protein
MKWEVYIDGEKEFEDVSWLELDGDELIIYGNGESYTTSLTKDTNSIKLKQQKR